MCPFCLSTTAIASGGGASGGLSALALPRVRRKHSASQEDRQ